MSITIIWIALIGWIHCQWVHTLFWVTSAYQAKKRNLKHLKPGENIPIMTLFHFKSDYRRCSCHIEAGHLVQSAEKKCKWLVISIMGKIHFILLRMAFENKINYEKCWQGCGERRPVTHMFSFIWGSQTWCCTPRLKLESQ